MKVTVIVQNRHIQRAIAIRESSGRSDVSVFCPLYQAIAEQGLIQGGFGIGAILINCDDGRNIEFSPSLDAVGLCWAQDWPSALASGKEYKFELDLEQEGE